MWRFSNNRDYWKNPSWNDKNKQVRTYLL
jgi:hypothetical protein